MNFKEVETKYRAVDIKLQDFVAIAESFKPVKIENVSGYDYYHVKGEDEFIRHRDGNKPELTLKRKTKDGNNFVRHETNLPISQSVPLEVVDNFCKELGFQKNFAVFKTCHIYWYETYDLVYYVVYDENMVERDRFIEIEMLESCEWESDAAAWAALQAVEKTLEPLGITAARRLRLSLFEMFRKKPAAPSA
jgi:adenylate cyclase class IV